MVSEVKLITGLSVTDDGNLIYARKIMNRHSRASKILSMAGIDIKAPTAENGVYSIEENSSLDLKSERSTFCDVDGLDLTTNMDLMNNGTLVTDEELLHLADIQVNRLNSMCCSLVQTFYLEHDGNCFV
ncbi:uncharacterized protein LOC130893442 [Diorhabda carinulata]|uniref:uncharacterized protein LOC130893442 n=1 Tax=Diorhabda carinulata TaxID=1163345 RepID=UPI0025A11930|nr:uncharacterized protein LOC130893442 [Diorhabda carinulata]